MNPYRQCNVISINRTTRERTKVNMRPITYKAARLMVKNTLTRDYRKETIEDAESGDLLYTR